MHISNIYLHLHMKSHIYLHLHMKSHIHLHLLMKSHIYLHLHMKSHIILYLHLHMNMCCSLAIYRCVVHVSHVHHSCMLSFKYFFDGSITIVGKACICVSYSPPLLIIVIRLQVDLHCHCRYSGYKMRNQLAAIDHNEHTDRPNAVHKTTGALR